MIRSEICATEAELFCPAFVIDRVLHIFPISYLLDQLFKQNGFAHLATLRFPFVTS